MHTFVLSEAVQSEIGRAGRGRDERARDRPGDARGHDDDVAHLLARLGDLPVAERRLSSPRETVIVGHLPLVERLARRFSHGSVALEDLVQAGTIGLILAVDRFDTRRGVPFIAYAIPTIVGSIQRYLRDAAHVVRTPRRREYGGLPRTVDAGPGGTGQLWRARSVGDAVHVTLLGDSEDLETGPGRLPHLVHTDPELDAADDHLIVARLVRSLGPRDRQLIYLRFYEDETLAQIAGRMGISVSRVSRLLTRALATLRDELEAPEGSR
jgi:RNA polymerase sigma-B factor